MVKDVIKNTIKNLKNKKIKNTNDIINCKDKVVSFSNNFRKIEVEIKYFLRKKMYDNKEVIKKNNNGKKIIKKLFNHIKIKPLKFIDKKKVNSDKFRSISDYISGMTDRFAIQLYRSITWIFLKII